MVEGQAVRKAVVPAAGLGTRFLPATKAQPKEMIPLVDRPALQYVVEEAVGAGLTDVLVVSSRGKEAMGDHFDRVLELEAALREKGKLEELEEVRRLAELGELHFVRQGRQLGLGHAVLQARAHVGEEPFAVLLGDDILEGGEGFLARMVEVHRREGRPVVAVREVPADQVSLYGIATATATGEDGVFEVTDLVEKPDPEEAPSTLAVIGRYVLPPGVFDVLEKTEPGAGGEIQLTDALRALARREPVLAVRHDGVRHDTGDKLGFLKATVQMAAGRADLGPAFREWLGGFVAGWDGQR